LYILPFDHRGSFQKKMFGWDGQLTSQQAAEIAAAKRVIYDAFVAAVAAGSGGALGCRATRSSSLNFLLASLNSGAFADLRRPDFSD
jgi:hypothetical protein